MQLVADKYIRLALEEDINSEDVTTNSVMPEYKKGEVQLICKEDGIIAGLPIFERVFLLLDPRTKVTFDVKDGDRVEKGRHLATVTGDIRVLLSGERTALNYLQRMSGIATYTNTVVKLLEGTRTKLLDTRKTTPCMRIFEKYAVRVGGGNNHRYNLSDGILLKDNHIDAAGGVKEAIAAAKAYAPFVRRIEVETENLSMVREAVEAGADIIALDTRITAKRGQAELLDLLQRIHEAYPQIGVMADCAAYEDAKICAESGCVDILSTTLSGLVRPIEGPDVELIRRLKADFSLPVNAEGRIWELQDIDAVVDAGADMITIGTAITRPHLITERFLNHYRQRTA